MKKLALVLTLSLAGCAAYQPYKAPVINKPLTRAEINDIEKIVEDQKLEKARRHAQFKAEAQANIPGESPTANTPSRPLKTSEKKAIKAVVGKDMFDEVSARWEWPDLLVNSFESDGETMTPYCGYVNAKNRMGAYTGFTPFLVIMSGKQIASIGSGVDWMCEKYGYTR